VHHSADTARALAEIARVLRPGGRVALMVYHRNSMTFWLHFMLLRGVLGLGLLREGPTALANRWSDGVVARHYTRRTLKEALEPHFEDVQTEVMGQIGEAVPLPAGPRRLLAPAVPLAVRRAVLRRFGWLLFATGRRRTA
jgi:SAM-dependent methyltransferase